VAVTTYEDLVEVRFCVEYIGDPLRVCKLTFSQQDSSLYLFPYAPTGEYHFGRLSIPQGEQEATIPFDQQETSDQTPKISIHESGQVHVKAGRRMAGPMFASPLGELGGQHLATVTCVRFAGLSPLGNAPRTTGRAPDVLIPAGNGVESGRLVFYANAAEPSFADPCSVTCRLVRSTLDQPLFLGIRFLAQRPLSQDPEAQGVVTIAGWDPRNPPPITDQADHLYVVAK
jgi:hypothetical protein